MTEPTDIRGAMFFFTEDGKDWVSTVVRRWQFCPKCSGAKVIHEFMDVEEA